MKLDVDPTYNCWEREDGTEILVTDMSNSHLYYAIRMLVASDGESSRDYLLPVLMLEVARRFLIHDNS